MIKHFVSPLFDKLDQETNHLLIRELLHLLEDAPDSEALLKELTYKGERFTHEKLHTKFKHFTLENPLLVAAGWDKLGVAVKALQQIGFAGVEVGTIPANPQPGNPRPRHFSLAQGVMLNRYGFNTPGMEVIAENLEKYNGLNLTMGISLGQNKEVTPEDAPAAHAQVAKCMLAYGTYFVTNVSSPNTTGLRQLQNKGPLTDIVKAVNTELQGKKPHFVKIAPDLTFEAINDVIEVVLENNLDGIIATNTTSNSEIKAKYGENWRNEMGGLSGDDKDYRSMSTKIIAHIYKQVGDKIDIIGAGGIIDTATALEKIKAGAKAVQIYAALDTQGPHLPGIINRGLVEYMDKEGVKNIAELVGVDAKK